MSIVYVVQNQHRWDKLREKFVPRFDFTAAERFGQLEFLLSPTASPFSLDDSGVVEDLKTGLASYNPNEDYLLLVGNPCLIGLAVAVAQERGDGKVRMLQWGKGDYQEVEARL